MKWINDKLNLFTRIGQCLFLFISITSHSQILVDINVEPKPYQFGPLPFVGQIIHDRTKQVIFMIRMDLERNLHNDTLGIHYFDNTGKKTKQTRYENHKPAYDLYYKYADTSMVEYWRGENTEKQLSAWRGIYTFDKTGKKTATANFYILKKDTISKSYVYYQYDRNDKLVKRTDKVNGNIQSVNNYYYDKKGNLIKHALFMNKDAMYHMESEYSYNDQNLLTKKNEFAADTVSRALNSYHFFFYDNKKLSEEKYITSPAVTETTVKYQYDEKGRLKEMKITKDTLYKQVHYYYKNDRPDKVTVETNAWNGLHGEFYIPLSSINSLTKTPILYEEQYYYDDKGNRVEMQCLLNGELKRIMAWVITYY